MAATLLAFSYNVLSGIELLSGAPLPTADRDAYLHLWRYIGFLLGVRDENNPCARGDGHARVFLESIVLHLLHPDDLSRSLARHMLRAPPLWRRGGRRLRGAALGEEGAAGAAAAAPEARDGAGVDAAFLRNAQMTRALGGDALSDALRLPSDARARRHVGFVLVLLKLYGLACRSVLIGAMLLAAHRAALRVARRFGATFPHSAGVADGCPAVTRKRVHAHDS